MATAAELEDQFQQERQGRESLTDTKKRLETEAGLDERRRRGEQVQKSILDTDRLLRDTPQRVASRARRLGGPITEGTRQQLTQVQQQPLVSQLADLGREEDRANIGIDRLNQEIASRMGLLIGERTESDADFVRRINAAYQRQRDADTLRTQRELARMNRQPSIDIQKILDSISKEKQT